MTPVLWTLALGGVCGAIFALCILISHRAQIDQLYGVIEGLCAAQFRLNNDMAELRAEVAALRARLVRLGRAFPEDVSPSIVD